MLSNIYGQANAHFQFSIYSTENIMFNSLKILAEVPDIYRFTENKYL